MNAKEYLQQIEVSKKRIRNLREQITDLETAAAGLRSVQYDRDKVQGGGDPDRIGSYIARMEAKQEELRAEIRRLSLMVEQITNQIGQLENEDHVWILRHRYILCEPWPEIMRQQDRYTAEKSVYRWHGQALQAFRMQFRKR